MTRSPALGCALAEITALAAVVAVMAAPVAAQPADRGGDGSDALQPTTFDPATCKKKRAPARSSSSDALPVTFKEIEFAGSFVDSSATVRELLTPVLDRYRALTDDARDAISASAAEFGYHVLGLGTHDTPTGTNAVIHLRPLPMVRRVNISINQGFFSTALKDEVGRRLRVRTGTYLPWPPDERQCLLAEERRRVESFLHDEGYFDADARLGETIDSAVATLDVDIDLGEKYITEIDKIVIPGARRLPIDETKIRNFFREYGTCLAGRRRLCIGGARYTRANHEAGKQQVIDAFRRLGFPAVSVRITNFVVNRRTKTVKFELTIDPRRQVDARFEGDFSEADQTLLDQLTFNKAASFDDVEKDRSARALASHLQARGFFDARVTWYLPTTAARGDQYQPLAFVIHQGGERKVRAVEFVGNHVIDSDELASAIATKPVRLSTSILGTKPFTTSAQLASDTDRLVALYRGRGYRDAKITVAAATTPEGLASPALAAALLSAERGGDLFVRFSIDEGQPTLISELHVELGERGEEITTPEERALCNEVLTDLSQLFGAPEAAQPATPELCVGLATAVAFREDQARGTRDLVRDRMFGRGRPRAKVEYEAVAVGPHRVSVVYRLRDVQELRVGKIVIRGNFRTRSSVIRDQLTLREGAPLTSGALAESSRRLRNTALFDSVNVKLPDLESTSAGAVNAVIEVTERHDVFARVDFEAGYSSFNGAFIKAVPTLKNLLGRGISIDIALTLGLGVSEAIARQLLVRQASAETTVRIPRWLFPDLLPFALDTELTAFHRRQDTPRFGPLKTTGVTLGVSRTYDYPRTATRRSAQAITWGIQYDLRSRERNVDALRPTGADDDAPQVPITTQTGSLGSSFEWERRTDRLGNLSPLAPESGFRLEARAAFYSPYLGGDDTFLKFSAAGSKYWSPFTGLVLRADARYDHGVPLAGAQLLPEVERFFAGGDSTVRGYADDRLATELIRIGVPPLGNVEQIRILPAGGNIRALASVDAQVRIAWLVYTALFADAGVITNQWSSVTQQAIRPSVGMALLRIVTPFGAFALERAVPLRPQLGDDPRGRWHISFAARAQF